MIEPRDLFDSRHYEAQRRPLTDARTPPAWCYTSEDFHRRERERIFLRAWNFVGRTDEIPSPGDYRCTETAGGPIIVLRDEGDGIRAFAIRSPGPYSHTEAVVHRFANWVLARVID